VSKTRKTIWRSDEKLTQDIVTGSGALSVTFNPEGSAKIEEIRLHLDTASATCEEFEIQLDSAEGATYDTLLFSHCMDTVKDVWFAESVYVFEGDKLTISWANSDSRTYSLEIIYRRYLA